MSNLLDKAIVCGLLAAVVFTTLALGTVEAWSVAIFELIVVVLMLLWAAKVIVEKRIEIRIPPAALPLGALVLVGLAQSIALTGSSGQTSSLSMDVEATRGAVAVIFFLFVSFLIAANFFDTPQRLRALANFLIIFGLALAVFALVQHFTWEGKLYWMRRVTSSGAGTGGPFVNRNHFAGYMEMLIPIPVALAFSRTTRGETRMFYGFAAAIMSIAEAASLSRGGMVSLAAGLLFLAAISVRRSRDRSHPERKSSFNLHPAFLIVVMLAAIAAGVVWIGADFDILKRITHDPLTTTLATDRRGVWGDTLTMFRAHPILGIGLGAFETVYPIYGRGDGSFVIQFAHNDYLQVLADGGIVGGAIALWFIIVIARAVMQVTRSADPFLRALGLGSAAGVFALLVHSLFDFNLQIPSNALLFLLLAAIVSRAGAAVSLGTADRGRRTSVVRRLSSEPAVRSV
ncbi:MAG TPA: O-antigen ligase family protein [Blastocatellia bacterium]|nr:O-antigen ligase family protein [Blastocatellia bacterium]